MSEELARTNPSGDYRKRTRGRATPNVDADARTRHRGEVRLVALASALLVAASATAQPVIRVRAKSRIELRTERLAGGVRVTGYLRDDLGTGLGGRSVRVRVRGLRSTTEAVQTAPDGAFALDTDLPPGRYALSASFDGDEGHEALEVERDLDLARHEVRLMVRLASSELDLERESHEVTVEARSEGGATGIEVVLLDELQRELARGRTDGEGRMIAVLRSEDLGAPGPGRLRAKSTADATRAEAQTEVPIVRVRETRLEASLSTPRVSLGESTTVRGQLFDAQGPLAGRAVGIYEGEAHRVTVLTDDSGEFEAPVETSRAGGERVTLLARFQSDSPGRPSSESEPMLLSVEISQPRTWAWSLLPVGLCLVGLLLLRRRKIAPAPRPTLAPKPEAGVVVRGERRRGAREHTVGGRILDQRDEAPLAARVVATGPEEREARADADGRWSLELAPGTWTLRFVSERHAPEEIAVEVPHRGEHAVLEVRLESWRRRILASFQRVARKVLRREESWRLTTIHEVRQRDVASPPLRALGEEVERLYYGSLAPEPADAATVDQRARSVEADLDGSRASDRHEGEPGARRADPR